MGIKLPFGLGEIDFKGFGCPVKAGPAELDLDLTLSSTIPAKFARTTIELKATATNSDKLLCVQIKTSPADESFELLPGERDLSDYGYERWKREKIFKEHLEIMRKHNSDPFKTWFMTV